MSKVYVPAEVYQNIKHCLCGHKPIVLKEYRSYGIITGAKFNYFVHCQHCKRTGAKFYHYQKYKALNKAIAAWNRMVDNEKATT